MTLHYSGSRGIRPLRARGTGKCYPKQLPSPASCGALKPGGEGKRARANLGMVGRWDAAPPSREGGAAQARTSDSQRRGQDLRKAPPSRAVKIEVLFLQILTGDETRRQQFTNTFSLHTHTQRERGRERETICPCSLKSPNQPSCYPELMIRHETRAPQFRHETCWGESQGCQASSRVWIWSQMELGQAGTQLNFALV